MPPTRDLGYEPIMSLDEGIARYVASLTNNDAASTPHGITKIRYYQCGYCVNEMSHIYKGYPKEKTNFSGRGVSLGTCYRGENPV